MATKKKRSSSASSADTALEVALDELHPSPSNPRRTISADSIRELAETIGVHGILQPLLVRPRAAGGYEIVCGERRWRAARYGGFAVAPVRVRKLDDRAVLEIQTIENDQREDVPPLEQAEALRTLHEDHGVPVDELAARLGRDVGYVYRRLRLSNLVPDGRHALEAGHIGLGVAEAVARLGEAQQDRVLDRLTYGADDDDFYAPPTLSDAKREIRRSLLRIVDAPFDVADPKLTSAPACGRCPSRTSAQVALFGDLELEDADDACTDATCWAAKIEATWNAAKKAAKKAGQQIVAEGAPRNKYSRLPEGFCTTDSYGRDAVAEAERLGVEPALVRDENGAPVWAVSRVALDGAQQAEARDQAADPERQERAATRVHGVQVAQELTGRLTEAVLSRVEGELVISDWAHAAFWRPLVAAAVAKHSAERARIEKRRGIDVGEAFEGYGPPYLIGMLVEAALARWNGDTLMDGLIEAYGIDRAPYVEAAEAAVLASKGGA